MPLLNYTTEVEASKSRGEIMAMLQTGGVTAILLENNGAGEIEAISFRMKTFFGELGYRLPANVAAVTLAINEQIKSEGRGSYRRKRKIPLNLMNNKEQAERIAWRIVKDWLEAQLAINTIGAAKLEQVMLPFAVDETGETFYSRLLTRGTLLLK